MTSAMVATIDMPRTEESVFTQLYLDCFPAVARYIQQQGGSLEEAKDVFQEALLVYYEKAVLGDFLPVRGTEAYLLGISRNLFLKARQRSLPTSELKDLEFAEAEAGEPLAEKIMALLETAGKKCMDLLASFYYEKLSMKGLAARFGYRTERSATVQKYKCLEKIRDTIAEKSLEYEDFLD